MYIILLCVIVCYSRGCDITVHNRSALLIVPLQYIDIISIIIIVVVVIIVTTTIALCRYVDIYIYMNTRQELWSTMMVGRFG